MKWIVKAPVQAGLGLMPARLSDPTYPVPRKQNGRLPAEIYAQKSYTNEVRSLVERIRHKNLCGLNCGTWFWMVSDTTFPIVT